MRLYNFTVVRLCTAAAVMIVSGCGSESKGPSGSGGAGGSAATTSATTADGSSTTVTTTGTTGGATTSGEAGSTGVGGNPGTTASSSSSASASTAGSGGAAASSMNFFVTSNTSTTGNLGGLVGADNRCQDLAQAVGEGNKTWRAYLSTENPAVNAIDRIGPGPYYNSKGEMIAADKAALHARAGDSTLFVDEHGKAINGQWAGSPKPVEHDILTGTQRNGTLAPNLTCGDWTNGTSGMSSVGHADGLGPNMSTTGSLSYWNAAHTGMCADTAPGGGAGRLYCFVGP